MFLIQVLVPLADNNGARFPDAAFAKLSTELASQFGGLTAYTRSPAIGLWQPASDESPRRDDVVVFEVVADELDRSWWAGYRTALEQRFRQDDVMIRAHEIHRL